jgi:hypothetical protein
MLSDVMAKVGGLALEMPPDQGSSEVQPHLASTVNTQDHAEENKAVGPVPVETIANEEAPPSDGPAAAEPNWVSTFKSEGQPEENAVAPVLADVMVKVESIALDVPADQAPTGDQSNIVSPFKAEDKPEGEEPVAPAGATVTRPEGAGDANETNSHDSHVGDATDHQPDICLPDPLAVAIRPEDAKDIREDQPDMSVPAQLAAAFTAEVPAQNPASPPGGVDDTPELNVSKDPESIATSLPPATAPTPQATDGEANAIEQPAPSDHLPEASSEQLNGEAAPAPSNPEWISVFRPEEGSGESPSTDRVVAGNSVPQVIPVALAEGEPLESVASQLVEVVSLAKTDGNAEVMEVVVTEKPVTEVPGASKGNETEIDKPETQTPAGGNQPQWIGVFKENAASSGNPPDTIGSQPEVESLPRSEPAQLDTPTPPNGDPAWTAVFKAEERTPSVEPQTGTDMLKGLIAGFQTPG